MIRFLSILVGFAGLAACTTQTSDAVAPAVPAASFEAPMDPGLISCQQITTNSAALVEASDWMAGRLRAAVLSGQRSGPVSDAAVRQDVQVFCAANPGARLRNASAQMIGS